MRQVSNHPHDEKQIDHAIDAALAEDAGHGDITSQILIPHELEGKARILAKAKGVLAGGDIAKRVFERADPSLRVEVLIEDGAQLKPGDTIATITGRVTGILKAERTALNFLQRLSGIASQTERYVARIRRLGVDIADTRKTTPGLRQMEKGAVKAGGGRNHRLHLGDGILIKDNHLAALGALGMSLEEIVAKARQNAPPGLKVEVEVSSYAEALAAAGAGADIIMLDNMEIEEMRRVASSMPAHIEVEASGGVKWTNVRAVAETGVDFISVGALTHSATALDISLELEPQTLRLI